MWSHFRKASGDVDMVSFAQGNVLSALISAGKIFQMQIWMWKTAQVARKGGIGAPRSRAITEKEVGKVLQILSAPVLRVEESRA